eukprot:TRINITY_DN61530_c0_g1_i1.p1 TRINITY_DN61530_c0_g1~~TRINITY_DN61530_c0_g1_i1.p1  ORF type:complete len:471 (-),score=64.71 TRINITY_DN61530_c0_g1_i1:58-1470(-)
MSWALTYLQITLKFLLPEPHAMRWRAHAVLCVAGALNAGSQSRPFAEEAVRLGASAPRLPDVTIIDFETDEEVAQHIPEEARGFTSRRLHADIVELFGSTEVSRHWTVLELGVASCRTTAVLSDVFQRVIAVDWEPTAMRRGSREGIGNRGNVMWLTMDVYRDPLWSALAANDIHVVLQDAGHTEHEVAADLRAAAKLEQLRYVIVHDFNFERIQRAVFSLARDYEVVAAIGEGRHLPLDERPLGEGKHRGNKSAEAVLLRPRRWWQSVPDTIGRSAADQVVEESIARFLGDADVQKLMLASLFLTETSSEEAAASPFVELCETTFWVADELDSFDALAKIRFKCRPSSQALKGIANLHEPGKNLSRAVWRHSHDAPTGHPKVAAPWGHVRIDVLGTRNEGRSYIMLPSAARRSFLWGSGDRWRVAMEQSAVASSVQLSLGDLSPRATSPWGIVTGPLKQCKDTGNLCGR